MLRIVITPVSIDMVWLRMTYSNVDPILKNKIIDDNNNSLFSD